MNYFDHVINVVVENAVTAVNVNSGYIPCCHDFVQYGVGRLLADICDTAAGFSGLAVRNVDLFARSTIVD